MARVEARARSRHATSSCSSQRRALASSAASRLCSADTRTHSAEIASASSAVAGAHAAAAATGRQVEARPWPSRPHGALTRGSFAAPWRRSCVRPRTAVAPPARSDMCQSATPSEKIFVPGLNVLLSREISAQARRVATAARSEAQRGPGHARTSRVWRSRHSQNPTRWRPQTWPSRKAPPAPQRFMVVAVADAAHGDGARRHRRRRARARRGARRLVPLGRRARRALGGAAVQRRAARRPRGEQRGPFPAASARARGRAPPAARPAAGGDAPRRSSSCSSSRCAPPPPPPRTVMKYPPPGPSAPPQPPRRVDLRPRAASATASSASGAASSTCTDAPWRGGRAALRDRQ